jgi:hypothetical protein
LGRDIKRIKTSGKCRNKTAADLEDGWCGGSTTTLHTTAVWPYILRRRRFGSKGGMRHFYSREKAEKCLLRERGESSIDFILIDV